MMLSLFHPSLYPSMSWGHAGAYCVPTKQGLFIYESPWQSHEPESKSAKSLMNHIIPTPCSNERASFVVNFLCVTITYERISPEVFWMLQSKKLFNCRLMFDNSNPCSPSTVTTLCPVRIKVATASFLSCKSRYHKGRQKQDDNN